MPGAEFTQRGPDYTSAPVTTLDEFTALAHTDPTPVGMSDGTLTVYNDAQKRLKGQCRFFHVDSDYYNWAYEQRARVMGCPSTFHLCKTLIFDNTKYRQDESQPIDHNRYWAIIVQYEGAVNVPKLEKAVRERTGASRKATHLRIAAAEKSLELTGFTNNAVSPVGMKSDIPILISSAIAELDPPLIYLGAGHVDWKIAIPVKGLLEHWNASIVDFQ
ncbi:hypothetical protein DFQ27_007593 [Actinomortierella ambigua]|uniref:YbaK/aminoacyl-tRNA synthetase-associated domain-containing protein n=1 Tax=Actinomortierella ambigua TaxID=1343610 RepID=A0A9P6QIS9_9FUNG|nr:hypothetical protein DFQ26_006781 [Actinomortierella ambigua]KAG0268089.1 hypothetical protein DFQ27_007593 [Actinomortierella ambigua]